MSSEKNESRNNAAVNFLGSVVREQPEIIEDLPPRDAHILFAHSDTTKYWKSFGDLEKTVTRNAGSIYNRTLQTVFEKAKPEIQEVIPLSTIYESINATSRARAAEATRISWQNPERREKARKIRKSQIDSHATRVRRSEAAKRNWDNPEYREKQRAGYEAAEVRNYRRQTPQSRALIGEASRASWQDPKYRSHMSEVRRGKKKSPETRARMSEAAKRRMQDPDQKARLVEANRDRWADPEYRARMIEAGKRRWADPEYRARMSEWWKDPEHRARMGELSRASWQDPKQRTDRIKAIKRSRGIDFQLWKYASGNGLVDLIVEGGLMRREELSIIEEFLNGNKNRKSERLLNKFSKLVADLS